MKKGIWISEPRRCNAKSSIIFGVGMIALMMALPSSIQKLWLLMKTRPVATDTTSRRRVAAMGRIG